LEAAKVELKRTIELDPKLAEAHYTLGVTDWQTGDFAAAENEMRAALALRPDYAEAYYMLGTLLKQQDKLDDAAKALREAIRLNPETPGPFNTLAQILRVQGDTEGSKAAFADAARVKKVKEGEQAATFNINTGLDNLSKGKLDIAEQQFRMAIQAAPQVARAHRGLAEVLERGGKKAAAAREFAIARDLEVQALRKK
jgi:Tfp pilus assembly protein PilF